MKKSVLVLTVLGLVGVLNAQNFLVSTNNVSNPSLLNETNEAKVYVEKINKLNSCDETNVFKMKEEMLKISAKMDRIIQKSERKTSSKKPLEVTPS